MEMVYEEIGHNVKPIGTRIQSIEWCHCSGLEWRPKIFSDTRHPHRTAVLR